MCSFVFWAVCLEAVTYLRVFFYMTFRTAEPHAKSRDMLNTSRKLKIGNQLNN